MKDKKLLTSFVYVVVGSVLFAFAVNMFIVPLNLFNGGVVGIAQLIRTMLVETLHLDIKFDIAGIINSLLNLPLFLMAYKSLSKHFFLLTLTSVVTQTIAFTLIPIMPIVPDVLTSVIIGGLIGGFGSAWRQRRRYRYPGCLYGDKITEVQCRQAVNRCQRADLYYLCLEV